MLKKKKKFFAEFKSPSKSRLCAINAELCAVVLDNNAVVFADVNEPKRRQVANFSRQFAISRIVLGSRNGASIAAIGDAAGKIHVVEIDFARKSLVKRLVHWHSSRVRWLEFSADGEKLFSGGDEAVLVKWAIADLTKEAFAPRLSAEIVNGGVVHESCVVVVALKDASIDVFSHNLELEARFALFHVERRKRNSVFWHRPTATFVYARSSRSLNFHCPTSAKDEIELEISDANKIRGGRKSEKSEDEVDSITFHVSANGVWIATAFNKVVRVWRFQRDNVKKFELSADFRDCHDDQEVHQVYVNDAAILLTASKSDLKLFQRKNDLEKWRLNDVFKYKAAVETFGVSMDATVLAVAYDNRTIGLWSLYKGQLKATLAVESRVVINGLDFAAHRLIATAEDKIAVWNLFSLELESETKVKNAIVKAVGSKALMVEPKGAVWQLTSSKFAKSDFECNVDDDCYDFCTDENCRKIFLFSGSDFETFHLQRDEDEDAEKVEMTPAKFIPSLGKKKAENFSIEVVEKQIELNTSGLSKPLSNSFEDFVKNCL